MTTSNESKGAGALKELLRGLTGKTNKTSDGPNLEELLSKLDVMQAGVVSIDRDTGEIEVHPVGEDDGEGEGEGEGEDDNHGLPPLPKDMPEDLKKILRKIAKGTKGKRPTDAEMKELARDKNFMLEELINKLDDEAHPFRGEGVPHYLRDAWKGWSDAVERNKKEIARAKLAKMTPEERLTTCYHEAGHAVAIMGLSLAMGKTADWLLDRMKVSSATDEDITLLDGGGYQGGSTWIKGSGDHERDEFGFCLCPDHRDRTFKRWGGQDRALKLYEYFGLVKLAGPAATAIHKKIGDPEKVLMSNGGVMDSDQFMEVWSKAFSVRTGDEDLNRVAKKIADLDLKDVLFENFYRAKRYVKAQWKAVEALAKVLNEKGTLTGEECKAIVDPVWNHTAVM